MGTVARTKQGRLIAELVQAGERACVCRGGAGGAGVVAPSKKLKVPRSTKKSRKLAVRYHTLLHPVAAAILRC